MSNKDPRAVLKLCKGVIHIYDIFYNEKLRETRKQQLEDVDFGKVFISLVDAVKMLF